MQLCRESLTRRSDCFTDQEVPASELRSHQSGRKGENWTKRSAACRNRIDDFKVSQKLNSNSIEFQAIRKWAVGGYLEAAITRMERGSLRCSLVFPYIYGTEKESAAFRPLQSRRVRSAQTLQSEREGKRRESMHLSWPTLMSTLSTQKREAYMWKAPSFEGENWKDHLILLSLSTFFPPSLLCPALRQDGIQFPIRPLIERGKSKEKV